MNWLSKLTIFLGFASVVLDILFNQADILRNVFAFLVESGNQILLFLFQPVSVPLVAIAIFLPLFIYSVWKNFAGSLESVSVSEFPQKHEYKNFLFIVDTTYSGGERVLKIEEMLCKICASDFFVRVVNVEGEKYLVCEGGHLLGGDLSPEMAKEKFDIDSNLLTLSNFRSEMDKYHANSLQAELKEEFKREYSRQHKLEIIQKMDESTD